MLSVTVDSQVSCLHSCHMDSTHSVPESCYSKCNQNDLSGMEIWLETVREGELLIYPLRLSFWGLQIKLKKE